MNLMGIDLFTVIDSDVGLTYKSKVRGKGKEYCGPCPFCGGDDRLLVWPNHPDGPQWACMGQSAGRAGCDRGGDKVAYLVERGDITPAEAWRLRNGSFTNVVPSRHCSSAQSHGRSKQRTKHRQLENPTWDPEAALAALDELERALWSKDGDEARDRLHNRGLEDDAIRRWRLGYNGRKREVHGLWVAKGIVIPCFVEGELWYLKVRRQGPPPPDPKYKNVSGSKSVLFGLDHLVGKRVVVICEGEFDAMLLHQEAGDLVDVVAMGRAQNHPHPRHITPLLGASRWLVASDGDTAGEQGAEWWMNFSTRVRRARPPQGNDLTDFYLAGGNLRLWVSYHLDQLGLTSEGEDPKSSKSSTQFTSETDTIEQRARRLLKAYDGSVEWAKNWADLAQEAEWPCWGMTWQEWVEEVAASAPI